MASADRLSALAPAKVNLFLHVGPVAADGYHPLCSLVVFADIGDLVAVEPAERLSLRVTGAFAAGLEGDDNLILTALRALGQLTGGGEPRLRVTLDKRLPIAAGLGGGSSDAGAALRLARRALGLDLNRATLEAVAATVGADGPMCLHARSTWAEGRGEVLTEAPDLPPLHAVMANPGVPSSTGAIYRAYDAAPRDDVDRPAPPPLWSAAAVTAWLRSTCNDLQDPAVALQPRIGEALAAMAETPGVRLSRMSGSGATVFGLFDDVGAAAAAATGLAKDHPGWWVKACRLGHVRPTKPSIRQKPGSITGFAFK